MDRGHSASLAKVLVACVRDNADDRQQGKVADYIERFGASELTVAAIRHGVIGSVWSAVQTVGLADRPDVSEMHAVYEAHQARHQRTAEDLRFVVEILGSTGAVPLVLKGPVLTDHVYATPNLRFAANLDLLVAPADFSLALATLEEADCQVLEADWRLASQRLLGELRLMTPNGTLVDLHWHLLDNPDLRAAFHIDVAGARNRAHWVEAAGQSVRTLDRTDTIVFLALKACLAGGHRLIWLKDLEQAIAEADRAGELDWELLIHRVHSWQAAYAVSLMLTRAKTVLQVPIPSAVFAELQPDLMWRAAARLVEFFDPVPRAGLMNSPAGLIARAARGDRRASRRELFRTVRHGRSGLPIQPAPAIELPRPLHAAHDAAGAVGVAGDSPERVAFLRSVCEQP